jgi:hypothetical protein
MRYFSQGYRTMPASKNQTRLVDACKRTQFQKIDILKYLERRVVGGRQQKVAGRMKVDAVDRAIVRLMR